MTTVRFYLNLSPEQYLSYYKGAAKNVVARAHSGERIGFPADRLRPFITHEGIHGEFELVFDENHRFQSLQRIGPRP